ncbi:fatty acid oxidation complex subunit alpha FadB [Thalassotalea agarivorans]|uniref:Fatty acid oxidation complex subunit alpha n=1 Tax=Thalassotalea agarivorans TaxID=349064 RepID=A0A1I0H671_THASX|nr:fatty acid oxidation complex subunit alpha FadB [Thalassotalea agarivorans]SET79108.1 3-hydroxyacyl-CoA dehydrogenase / enoyl-CoA hydratase / 3-hydroxybutyryl-CoA epimerase / enoyl-CoA isomerase [Thalassotalea agarivorans]
MLFEGKSLSAQLLDNGIVEMKFDAQGSVNKFDQATFAEFSQVIEVINQCEQAKGVLVTSGKSAFIVGADITEFLDTFKKPEDELIPWIKNATDIFDAFEDLDMPTIAAVNGFALGGGCEMTLACDYRVADTTASIGLPEVKLGLMPGFGGTVRLPRLIGADNAVEWMSTGKPNKPEKAMAVGVVDAVVAPEQLKDAAIQMLTQAIEGKLDWRAKRQPKLEPLKLSQIESVMTFTTCKGMIAAKAGKHYPAPMVMVSTIEAAALKDRAGAMALENAGFAKLAKTDAATAQIGLFMSDQVIKGKAKKAAKSAQKQVNKAAVLGAGIMGGGIAYQSAYKGTPIVMKDINDDALDLGLTTAAGILTKLVERGRLNAKKMAGVLNNITPSLSYDSMKDTDIVVEAVVENPKVKGIVLAEVEGQVAEDTIITSNTSTISIDLLAESVSRKDKFCGMHFFNPVHKMPLVEVIRGKDTSDETVATVVAYAAKMGKSPIVVNDCPGFYVNRVLFPYFAGFSQLVLEGADFTAVDKVMEKQFGWPMGPAYLLDVVGIDTADHCTGVMSAGFPTRMAKIDNDPVTKLYGDERYGQKNGKGFYDYGKDKRGKPTKVASEQAYALIGGEQKEFSADEIIARLMIPMVNEVVRCLEEGVVASAAEADMGLIYGLGFPPFRGGPIRYLETLGLDNFIAMADKYAHLGEIYQVTDGMREMAASGQSYFSTDVKKA